MKKLFALFIAISITLGVNAQSPQKMSYQCVVRNASGALVSNQSVGIRGTILQGNANGTLVYQETELLPRLCLSPQWVPQQTRC
jgi:hypothetical protein